MPFWMGLVLTANVRLTPFGIRNDFSVTGRRSLPSPSITAKDLPALNGMTRIFSAVREHGIGGSEVVAYSVIGRCRLGN
jgi:hypothetical protein